MGGAMFAALSALSSALRLSAELAGSALKIIPISLRPDRMPRRGFKGAILIERIFAKLGLPQQPRQLGDIRRDPSRRIFTEQLGDAGGPAALAAK
jgi:hypothetical protein